MSATRCSTSQIVIIAGKTTEIGVPVSRIVKVYSRTNGMLLVSTRSNRNGEYKIYVPLDKSYTITSIDSNKKYNAVIQDNVVPK